MNPIDIAVLVVLLASALFALMRGFVYEVLAMAGWIAAGLATVWGLPLAKPLMQHYIANQTLSTIAAGAAIFLVVLLVSSLITHAIARQVRKSAISPVDRSLGFAFGLARGLLLASLCYMVTTKLISEEPEIVKAAKTRPLIVFGTNIILSVVPSEILGVEDKAKEAVDAAQKAAEDKEMFDRLTAPQPKSGEQSGDKPPAYDNKGLERLIENGNGK